MLGDRQAQVFVAQNRGGTEYDDDKNAGNDNEFDAAAIFHRFQDAVAEAGDVGIIEIGVLVFVIGDGGFIQRRFGVIGDFAHFADQSGLVNLLAGRMGEAGGDDRHYEGDDKADDLGGIGRDFRGDERGQQQAEAQRLGDQQDEQKRHAPDRHRPPVGLLGKEQKPVGALEALTGDDADMVEIGGQQFLLRGGRILAGDLISNRMQVLGADCLAEFAEDGQGVPEIIPVEILRTAQPEQIDGQQNEQDQADDAVGLLGGEVEQDELL